MTARSAPCPVGDEKSPRVETSTGLVDGRIQSLDALRGFALFGIILVNAPFFAGPPGGLAPETLADHVALFVVTALFAGKFFLVFSFLFGFGFASILARSKSDEADLRGRFLRRLLALFAFGAAHAVFLFIGDILMLYALLGYVLWACRRLPFRRLVWISAGLLALGIVVQAVTLAVAAEDLAGTTSTVAAETGYLGGFAQVLTARFAELPESLGFILLFNGLPALSMFLLGLALGKSGLFPPSGPRLRLWAVWARLALFLGFGVSGLSTAGLTFGTSEAVLAVCLIGLCISAPALSFGIVATAIDWAERRPKALLTRWLAVAGRGSLTGYILHSVILGAVFYGWGLGLYGQLGLAAVAGVAVLTFAVIVLVLNLWQRWFRYGPDEWLLRSFVDLKWKPIRKATP